jgi:hypothetical protein
MFTVSVLGGTAFSQDPNDLLECEVRKGCQGERKPDYLASWAPAVSFSVFQFLGWTGDGDHLAPIQRH